MHEVSIWLLLRTNIHRLFDFRLSHSDRAEPLRYRVSAMRCQLSENPYTFDVDAVVIGAGAVGLACAAALAGQGRSVVVLERAAHPGDGISSRNSEVIHSGLYYQTGSLKHELCVMGRRLLYDYLESRGVPYRKCGKLVVATDADEMAKIEAIYALGTSNAVEGLRLLTAAEVAALEPELRTAGGLLASETGIFDTHQYLLALIADVERGGGHVALRTPFEGAEPVAGGFRVRTGGVEAWELRTRLLVNAAGLSAVSVACAIEGLAPDLIPALRFAKGSYFRYEGRSPFARLIYPAPVDGGLGIHATIDMGGICVLARTSSGRTLEWRRLRTPM